MHHGTCVTHVPWWISGSRTRGSEKNEPSMPGVCATHNFTYLARGPWLGSERGKRLGTWWHANVCVYNSLSWETSKMIYMRAWIYGWLIIDTQHFMLGMAGTCVNEISPFSTLQCYKAFSTITLVHEYKRFRIFYHYSSDLLLLSSISFMQRVTQYRNSSSAVENEVCYWLPESCTNEILMPRGGLGPAFIRNRSRVTSGIIRIAANANISKWKLIAQPIGIIASRFNAVYTIWCFKKAWQC